MVFYFFLVIVLITILFFGILFVGGLYLFKTRQSSSLTDGIMDFLGILIYKFTGRTEQFRMYFILNNEDIVSLEKHCSNFLHSACVEVGNSWQRSGFYQIRITGIRPRSMYSDSSQRHLNKMACKTLQLFYRKNKGLNIGNNNCVLISSTPTEFLFEIPLTYTAEKRMNLYLQEKAKHMSK